MTKNPKKIQKNCKEVHIWQYFALAFCYQKIRGVGQEEGKKQTSKNIFFNNFDKAAKL